MTKNQIIHQVCTIILKYAKPLRIYLYGSQANGESNKVSDIDIAYDDAGFKDNYLIEQELEKIDTLLKIDVKNIAQADTRFTNRVKSTAKIIFSATKQLRAEDGLYNFAKALTQFIAIIDRKDDFEQEGFGDVFLDVMVKRFEFTYEMAWKALKRYLDYLGFEVKNPRATFKEAYAQEIIIDENIWLDMIEQRNLSSHVYDEYQIKELLDKAEAYGKTFIKLKESIEKGLP